MVFSRRRPKRIPDDLKYYQVEHMAATFADPYRFNTFGNLLESSGAGARRKRRLPGRGKSFDIRIHCLAMQTPKAADLDRGHRAAGGASAGRDEATGNSTAPGGPASGSGAGSSPRTAPCRRKRGRSSRASLCPTAAREEEDGAALATQSYNVFRFLMACQSRGADPDQVQRRALHPAIARESERRQARTRCRCTAATARWLTHEDDRLWGRRFTYQNQRLLYWPLLASGDFDLMKPFFDYYSKLLPMRRAITQAWFGHDGAYYRENIEPTGGERDCGKDGHPPKTRPGEKHEGWYHDYYFTSGLETTAMMLDYVDYTGDTAFRDRVLVPFAREVLLFFDRHYLRGRGRQTPPRPGAGDRDLVDRRQSGAGRGRTAVLPGRIAGHESRHGRRPGSLAQVSHGNSGGAHADR